MRKKRQPKREAEPAKRIRKKKQPEEMPEPAPDRFDLMLQEFAQAMSPVILRLLEHVDEDRLKRYVVSEPPLERDWRPEEIGGLEGFAQAGGSSNNEQTRTTDKGN